MNSSLKEGQEVTTNSDTFYRKEVLFVGHAGYRGLFGYLILSILSSFVLATGISRIGSRLRLAPGLFGLVTALGADAPEISSAVIALMSRNRDLGLSVVFGSNIFNLAAVLGLGAVIAGCIQISKSRLILNGAAGILILSAVVALLIDSLSPWSTLVLAGVVFIPYAILVGLHPSHIRRLMPGGWLHDLLRSALTPVQADQHDEQMERPAKWTDMLSLVKMEETITIDTCFDGSISLRSSLVSSKCAGLKQNVEHFALLDISSLFKARILVQYEYTDILP